MIFGILFFIFFICWTGFLWSKVLLSVFGIREKYVHIPLGIFASILTISFLSSMSVVWYRLTPVVCALIFAVGAALPFFLCKKKTSPLETDTSEKELFGIFPKRKFLIFCFAAISLLQVAILMLCQTDKPLLTPWQTIHPWYLYNFFLLTFLLVVLCCSKISFRLKFLCVVIYSLLLHLYLPLAHVMPWGGDVWRMIGVEQKLAAGQSQLPVLPQALWNPYKYTYGQMWGLMALISKVTSLSLLVLHRWSMALLWGIILPIVSFVLGRVLFEDQKKALVLSALSSFPFALQAIGSISVSVSFGFLTFVFAIMLWFLYLKEKTLWQKRIVFGLLGAMFFGYALYAILFLYVVISTWLLENPQSKKICIGWGIFSVLLFPLLDFGLGFSHFPASFSILTFLKQTLGQWSGWYFARPLQTTEVSSANVIFNQVPKSAYVANMFSALRWPVIFLMIGIGFFSLRTWFLQQKTLSVKVLQFLFLSVVGGYSIGWYILTGDRIFVRRLDSIFAFLLLLFTLYGIFRFDFSSRIARFTRTQKYICFFAATFVLSFVATTLYATGPDVRVMSVDEYNAAKYIFTQDISNPNPCVLSDTWILLALESVSSGRVVGGGFPINANFAQTERVALYSEFLKNPDKRIIPALAKVMPVPACFVALSRDTIDPRTEQRIHDFLGNPIFKFGSVLVWKMELKNP